MSYNDEYFEGNLNTKLKSRLSNLLSWQSSLLDYMAKYLVASNHQQQKPGCDAFLKLLVKIRFNLDSANILLPRMYEDYRYKTSINVIYRTIIDDLINSYYLFCTVLTDEPQHHALINELNILHKEFILGVIDGIKSEQQFWTHLNTPNIKTQEPVSDVEEDFKKGNPDLVDQDGKWKNNSAIRATTHPGLLKLFNQRDNSTFISETKKLEFLKSSGVPWYGQLKSIFKFLSQYQHFSPRAHDLLNSHIEQDIAMYQHSLGQIMTLLGQLFPVLELRNKDELGRHLQSLGDSMIASFNAEPR